MFPIFTEILARHGSAASGVTQITPLLPYMTARMRERADTLPLTPAYLIVAAFPYGTPPPDGAVNLPRYAWGEDYHQVLAVRLEAAAAELRAADPEHHYLVLPNGYPYPAPLAAALSGLGTLGLHGLLICPPYGSWVALGGVVTDNDAFSLCSSSHIDSANLPVCTQCGRCVYACPTGALEWDAATQTRMYHRPRCLAHITEARELTPEQSALLLQSRLLIGCDACQNACPHNQHAAYTSLPEFVAHPVHQIKGMSAHIEESFLEAYAGRGYATPKRFALLKRNAGAAHL